MNKNRNSASTSKGDRVQTEKSATNASIRSRNINTTPISSNDHPSVFECAPERSIFPRHSNQIHGNRLQSITIQINPIKSRLIPSKSIQSNPMQSNYIQTNPNQSNKIQSNKIETNRIRSNLMQSNPSQLNKNLILYTPVQSNLIPKKI